MTLPIKDDYKIKLDIFEGPLDLLLYLIKKDELDIYNIPIELIARQYMEYLGLMRMLDLNIAGDFLVMAATLMMIKSRMLLPLEERPDLEPEEEDPRWDLVRQLIEYKKFKEAAGSLQERELLQSNMFGRGTDEVAVEREPSISIGDVTIFDLIAAFNESLKRVQVDEIGEVFAPTCTVADKIAMILERIRQEERIVFSALFASAGSRHEVICMFLALLELVRLRQISAKQNGAFGEIIVLHMAS